MTARILGSCCSDLEWPPSLMYPWIIWGPKLYSPIVDCYWGILQDFILILLIDACIGSLCVLFLCELFLCELFLNPLPGSRYVVIFSGFVLWFCVNHPGIYILWHSCIFTSKIIMWKLQDQAWFMLGNTCLKINTHLTMLLTSRAVNVPFLHNSI